MVAKKSSTLHRCIEFTKSPTEDVCHQRDPPTVKATPEARTTTNDARLSTPNT